MKAGGIDPDEESRRNFKRASKLLSKKALSEAAQKIADFEASLASETDEGKRMTI